MFQYVQRRYLIEDLSIRSSRIFMLTLLWYSWMHCRWRIPGFRIPLECTTVADWYQQCWISMHMHARVFRGSTSSSIEIGSQLRTVSICHFHWIIMKRAFDILVFRARTLEFSTSDWSGSASLFLEVKLLQQLHRYICRLFYRALLPGSCSFWYQNFGKSGQCLPVKLRCMQVPVESEPWDGRPSSFFRSRSGYMFIWSWSLWFFNLNLL